MLSRTIHWSIACTLAVVGAGATLVLLWGIAKPEYTHHEIESGSTAVLVLLLTGLYGASHVRHSLHWLALPFFLVSAWSIADRWGMFLGGYFKNFAPASPEEAAVAFRETLTLFALAVACSTVAWVVVVRLTRQRLNRR